MTPLISKANALCEPLYAVKQGAFCIGGRVFLNTLTFSSATAQVKLSVDHAIRNKVGLPPSPIFEQIDAIERCVAEGVLRYFGKVSVKKQELDEHLDALEAELSEYEESPLAWQELRQVIASGTPFFGRLVLIEESVYAATIRLKRAVTLGLSAPNPHRPLMAAFLNSLGKLEMLILLSRSHFLWYVGVHQEDYEVGVERVRSALLPLETLLSDP